MILALYAAAASAFTSMRVWVVDEAGNLVPNAFLVFDQPNESDRHCVNSFDGSWEGSAVYLRGAPIPGGKASYEEVDFAPGQDVHFTVYAEGFAAADGTLAGTCEVRTILRPVPR